MYWDNIGGNIKNLNLPIQEGFDMNGQPKNDENQPWENANNMVENVETRLSDDEMNGVTAGTIPHIPPIVIRRGGEDMPPIILS